MKDDSNGIILKIKNNSRINPEQVINKSFITHLYKSITKAKKEQYIHFKICYIYGK